MLTYIVVGPSVRKPKQADFYETFYREEHVRPVSRDGLVPFILLYRSAQIAYQGIKAAGDERSLGGRLHVLFGTPT